MSNTYLTSNFGSGTDDGVGQKSTHSVWIKRTDADNRSTIISGSNSTGNYMKVRFGDNDRLQIYGSHSGSVNCNVETKAEFRDISGWYHVVLQIDTSNSTASERIKWYVNGELQELNTATYPSAGSPNYLVISDDLEIGRNAQDDNEHFDSTMSHFNATYGTVYAPTAFGETDATTGEWKIKTSPSVTYGTHGFFILKDGNSVTDQSGEGNHFTVAGGTLTKTEDCPSNVFATWNPLYRTSATSFAYGNTESQSPSTGGFGGISTLGASSGKYYAEFKLQAASATYEACVAVMVGSSISGNNLPSGYPEYTVGSYGIRQGSASSGSSFWTTAAGGRTSAADNAGFVISDTIGIALDIDNNRVYFSKGGQWNNSGSWNSATPSTYLTLISTYGDGQYLFVSGDSSGGNTAKWSANFGNGYQQTTAVSSAGTNASGIGIFEYDVPTGYTALSTKGLNL